MILKIVVEVIANRFGAAKPAGIAEPRIAKRVAFSKKRVATCRRACSMGPQVVEGAVEVIRPVGPRPQIIRSEVVFFTAATARIYQTCSSAGLMAYADPSEEHVRST